MPVSIRRRSISATNSSSGIGFFDIVDAIIASRLFPNPSIQIGAIYLAVKNKQPPCLIKHFRRGPRGELPHPIGNDVFDRDYGGDPIFPKVDHLHPISIGQPTQKRARDHLKA